MYNSFMRLHIRYRKKDFDSRLLDLTDRFFTALRDSGGRHAPDSVNGMLFDTWLHGACIVYELPYPGLRLEKEATVPGRPAAGEYHKDDMTIVLKRWSVISLFHQFRHHMQAFAEGVDMNDKKQAQDAQAWACSLFYVLKPRRFRKWVRRGRVAGVYPQDLLKRRQ